MARTVAMGVLLGGLPFPCSALADQPGRALARRRSLEKKPAPPAIKVEPPRARRDARIRLVGSPPRAADIERVVNELLSREAIDVTWSRVAALHTDEILVLDPQQPGLGVWLDLRLPSEVSLYFRDGAGERFIIRRLPLAGAPDEVGVEAVGQIVESSVVALLEQRTETLSRSEAVAVLAASPPDARARTEAAPESATATATDAGRSASVELGGGAAGAAFAPQLPVIARLEATVALMFRPRGSTHPAFSPSWGLSLALGYTWPRHYDGVPVGVELQAEGAFAAGVFELQLARSMALRVTGGLGINHVRYQPRNGAVTLSLANQGTFLLPLARLGAMAVLGPWGRWWAFAGAVADVALFKVHYDVRDVQGNTRPIVVPYTVQPGLVAGLEVRL